MFYNKCTTRVPTETITIYLTWQIFPIHLPPKIPEE